MKKGSRKKEDFHGVEHRTRNSAYEALGFSPEEAAVLEAKNFIWHAINRRIKDKNLTTPQLCRLLGIQASQVSDLRTRKVDKMTLDKFVKYARKLNLALELRVRVTDDRHRRAA